MSPHLPPADTARCPLCGQPNRCALAAGGAAESCWCMAQPVDRKALAALAPDQRGVACICAACGAPALADALAAPPPCGPPI